MHAHCVFLLPDSQRALCFFREDDGDSFQLADVPTDTVLENAFQEATRRPSGRHLLKVNSGLYFI